MNGVLEFLNLIDFGQVFLYTIFAGSSKELEATSSKK